MGKRSKKAASARAPASAMQTTTAPQLQDLKLDPRGDGMYSGTFRWLESKQFLELPDAPSTSLADALAKGWEGFLAARGDATTDLVAAATRDPSFLDALSFPIALAYIAQRLQLWQAAEREKHVLVIGASSKAEQRIWRITAYWHELARLFPQTTAITLWFIGPEVQDHDQSPRVAAPANSTVQARHFRGTFGAFQDAHASHDCTPENALIVGFNTGFGNFVESERHELLFSWLPDLYRIADSRIPALFTCANDYADMNGEFAVQSRVVGATLRLLPQQNPFSCASHLHEDGQRESAWSRGNSFLYVVQGADHSRRVQIASGDVVALRARLDAELDLHLEDALGRHFYRGMVLTKEQAARCKALSEAAAMAKDSTSHTSSSGSNAKGQQQQQQRAAYEQQLANLEAPKVQLCPGSASDEVTVLVHVPKVLHPSERIAVDVSDSMLSVFVPNKYLLRMKLPFPVADSDSGVQAQLMLPVLRLTLRKQPGSTA